MKFKNKISKIKMMHSNQRYNFSLYSTKMFWEGLLCVILKAYYKNDSRLIKISNSSFLNKN